MIKWIDTPASFGAETDIPDSTAIAQFVGIRGECTLLMAIKREDGTWSPSTPVTNGKYSIDGTRASFRDAVERFRNDSDA